MFNIIPMILAEDNCKLVFVKQSYLVPERKLSFSPISVSDLNFNPRNTTSITVVKIIVFLDLNEKSKFSFGYYLKMHGLTIRW